MVEKDTKEHSSLPNKVSLVSGSVYIRRRMIMQILCTFIVLL